MNIKSCGRLFQILWPSQKTWTLCILYMYVQVIFTYYIISIHCVLGRKRWPKVPLTANLSLTLSLCTQKKSWCLLQSHLWETHFVYPLTKGKFCHCQFSSCKLFECCSNCKYRAHHHRRTRVKPNSLKSSCTRPHTVSETIHKKDSKCCMFMI